MERRLTERSGLGFEGGREGGRDEDVDRTAFDGMVGFRV